MSKTNMCLEEEVHLSLDMSFDENLSTASINITDSSSSFTSENISEPEPVSKSPEWKGVAMDEILKGCGPFDFEHLPPIVPSAEHSVLFMLPLSNRGPPKAYPSHQVDKWNQDYVRLPHSSHSLYPYKQDDGTQEFRRRWEVIQEALLRNFYSSHELETAISSYNLKYAQRWDFKALHNFFSQVADEQETKLFFETLLPKIISLALQLPELITGAIPLLKRHTNASVSLSQLQVASLIANAFLCTFPRRNSTNPQSEYANYPYINFNRLFSTLRDERRTRCNAVMEKLKCIFHYFRRVTSSAPEGTITVQRKYVPKEDCPQWENRDDRLPLLHITSKGTIESEGAGLLQVDFANKFVGGGVLNWGCVQEEIRFVICPELLVTMLITEALDDTEALVICGVEQYSKYRGYSDNFEWAGDFVDETPRDSSGRRKTCIVAIDALYFRQENLQFNISNLTRELNKAYVGFMNKEMPNDSLCAIATGNWGCGAFRGNPKLKVLLQLMAAGVAKRSVVYFTFGDTELKDSVADLYWYLISQNTSIAELFFWLSRYKGNLSKNHSDFYRFLYNKGKMKENLKQVSQRTVYNKTMQYAVRRQKHQELPTNRYTSASKQTEQSIETLIEKWLSESDEDEKDENCETSLRNGKESDSNRNFQDLNISLNYNDKKTNFEIIEENSEKEKGAISMGNDSKESATQILEEKNVISLIFPTEDKNIKSINEIEKKTEKISEEIGTTQHLNSQVINSLNLNCKSLNTAKSNSSRKQSNQTKISDFFSPSR